MDDPYDSIKETIMRTRMDADFKRRKAEHEEARRIRARPDDVKSTLKYQQQNPEKVAARKALMWAVKRGEVVKAERCALNSRDCFGRIEGHHWRGYDWEFRFEVIWLCHKHHQMIELGELSLSPHIRPI